MTGPTHYLPVVPRLEDWAKRAACRNHSPDVFFPHREDGTSSVGQVRAAQRVCATCPVIEECAQYALDNHEMFGVWGGYSERDRKKIWAGIPVTRWKPIEHGTYKGYEAHRRLGVPMCDACYAAMQVRRHELWEARKQRGEAAHFQRLLQQCSEEIAS